MLHLVYRLKDLNFSALMAIYEEGNRENGDELYPELSPCGRMRQAQQDFFNYLKQDFFSVEGALYALWEAQGEFVSALRLEPYKNGYLLEALETAPAQRGRGYAKSLLQEVLQVAEHEGKLPVYSHIRKGNIPSEKVHAACGFGIHKDLAAYIDGSVDYRCNTWKYE